jgi:hypothetical protein
MYRFVGIRDVDIEEDASFLLAELRTFASYPMTHFLPQAAKSLCAIPMMAQI